MNTLEDIIYSMVEKDPLGGESIYLENTEQLNMLKTVSKRAYEVLYANAVYQPEANKFAIAKSKLNQIVYDLSLKNDYSDQTI